MPFCCVNLVDNAVRHILPEGCTTMRDKLSDQAVILEVENSRPGIPPDEHERIFERFYRFEWVYMVRALDLPLCETSPCPYSAKDGKGLMVHLIFSFATCKRQFRISGYAHKAG
ncbi:ATP-binding protein [Pseudomonas sp. LTJR-52]|uniref:ATP-binding protein n=1 Tax=Pseudomonas sp. LTJR-52 TaxID=2479392 RepID=UPI000EFCB1FA|nr:ATP-binding protein [Pseudomonas sp. LTJR-52]